MARVAGRLALDAVAVSFERVEQRSDLTGDLELVLVAAQCLELGCEVGVKLNAGHTYHYGVYTIIASRLYAAAVGLTAADHRPCPIGDDVLAESFRTAGSARASSVARADASASDSAQSDRSDLEGIGGDRVPSEPW